MINEIYMRENQIMSYIACRLNISQAVIFRMPVGTL